MTVHVLNTPFQLPAPDVSVINLSRQDLRHQAESLGNIYLPVLREKLLALLKELGSTDKQVLKALTLVPSALKNDGLQPFQEAIASLRESAGANATEAIAEFTRNLESQIDESLSKVEEHTQAFENSLTNFDAVTLSGVRHLVSSLEEEIRLQTGSPEAEEKARDKLVESETSINDLIAAVEKLSLVDKLKPLVASLEKLVEIDPKSPLIGSVKAGLVGVGNILNLTDDTIKYQDLIRARTHVQTQLDALRESIARSHDRHAAQVLKLTQLKAVQALDQPRTAYAQEIGKIAQALLRFVSNHRGGTGDILDRTSHFINHCATLSQYLNGIRSEWRS